MRILAASTLLALARAQAPPAAPAHGTTYTVFETGLTTAELSGLSWQRAMNGGQSTNPSCVALGGQLAAPSSLYWNSVLEAALRESGRKESDLTRRAPGTVMSAAI